MPTCWEYIGQKDEVGFVIFAGREDEGIEIGMWNAQILSLGRRDDELYGFQG